MTAENRSGAPAVRIRPLTALKADDLRRLITGYTSDTRYRVSRSETEDRIVLTLELEPLAEPYRKTYAGPDAETVREYKRAARAGYCFGAYAGEELVGLALAEPQAWNGSLQVRELHVAAEHRGQGIGRRLLAELAREAQAAGMRALVCETQTTNVPAIRFYRRLGFTLEGIDLSHYSNEDLPDGEVAVFMKKPLPEG